MPSAASTPPARPPASFFDEEGDDVSIDEESPPAKPVDLHAPGIYVPPPPTARVDWPAGICSDAEAEDALRCVLEGKTDARPLHALAAQVIEAASDLERAALKGEPQPFEVTAIRKATVIRLRVAEALATAPAPGSAVDTAALSAVLGQIDGLLAEVAPLHQGAPEEFVPALEAVRNSLVSEAIDFSEAAQRVAAVQQPAAAPRPAARKAATARILETHEGDEAVEPRRWGIWVLLALALLAVGAYHVRDYLASRRPVVYASLPGAPEGYHLVERGGRRYLIANPGEHPGPAVLEQFKAKQAQQDVEVQEIVPGTYELRAGKGAEK